MRHKQGHGVYVKVKCSKCKTTRNVGPCETNYPMCDRCYLPMSIVKARAR